MAKFRIDNIATLARQMSFTPAETRRAQLSAAEDLLHGLDPVKGYPLDYVIFRITGYHAKRGGAVSGELLTGFALQHDLGILIEHVSETLGLCVSRVSEPVLAIEDVTEKFNVTSKTIQRWRRRGLPARRFVFSDGRRRVGFLLSSVERFLAKHQDQVSRGSNFTLVDERERDDILRRARRLASMCQCPADEVARRIARKLNRSPLTVLHTIRKHDAEQPAAAIFLMAPPPIEADDRARILRAYRNGVTITALARRHSRPRSAIYRVIIEEQIARLARRKIRFIDDSLYHHPDAADAIKSIVQSANDSIASDRPGDGQRVPRDLPPYLAELYRTPLLSAQQERALFLKFNFRKYQFVQARRRLEPQFARARDLNALERHLHRATEAKNAIVRANLRLVVSIARKHLRPNLSLMELISDGNLTLMRAVESFDVHKGNRFSTYATLALMKGFARSVPLLLADRIGARGAIRREALDVDVADRRANSVTNCFVERDELRKLVSRLESRERTVLLAHYGLREREREIAAEHTTPATYEQLGERFGVSVQRIRQIERAAIEKLRASVQ